MIEHFIKRATEIHGEKYDYSKVDYKTNRIKVEIICSVHGSFWQIPSNHYKHGCNQCAREKVASKQLKKVSEFIKEAKKLHKGKYEYNFVNYIGAHRKVEIVCPLHGKFLQAPHSHLQGRGCYDCKQGIFHPRFGKSAGSSGYVGKYGDKVFRSFSELFWMINAEKEGIQFLSIDQEPHRQQWQAMIIKPDNRKGTYCPDFYLIEETKLIDIKPRWRMKKESWKLDQARKEYDRRGVGFEIIDCDTISVDVYKARQMMDEGLLSLSPKSEKRLLDRT